MTPSERAVPDPYWSDSVLDSALEAFVPERFREAHRAGLARVAAGEIGRVLNQRLDLRAVHRDGREFPIELTLTATETPAGRRFHAFAHDVTLAERTRRFNAVEAAVSYGLTRASSSADAATQVVQALGLRMDWPVVELWLVDEGRKMLTCPARFHASEQGMGDFAVDELEYGAGVPGAVCRTGRPVWVADLATDTQLLRSREAARFGLHVAVGVPIQSGAHVLGALAVYGDTVEDPEDNLITLLGRGSGARRAVSGTAPGGGVGDRAGAYQGRIRRPGHPRAAQPARGDLQCRGPARRRRRPLPRAAAALPARDRAQRATAQRDGRRHARPGPVGIRAPGGTARHGRPVRDPAAVRGRRRGGRCGERG